MVDKQKVYLFGHSFPARLLRLSRDKSESVAETIRVSDKHSVYIEGHPGLTYVRIFTNEAHYFSKLQAHSFDILCIDMGTNDLSAVDGTPKVVVDNTIKFLENLQAKGIRPKCIMLLSVIRRSRITRSGQVSITTFNNRVRRYNGLLSRTLAIRFPDVGLYPQRKIDNAKYLIDGCHLNAEGMIKYGRGLKDAITNKGLGRR